MSPVCDSSSESSDAQRAGGPSHAGKSLEEGSPKPETCVDAWSGCSFAPWVIGNMFFVCYCVFVIPKLLGPNPLVVHAFAGYIRFLGLSQLTECLMTGQGTNYGKFAGNTEV